MHGPMGESSFTKAVNALVTSIQSCSPAKDSLFEQAQIYFETSDALKKTRQQLLQNCNLIESSLKTATKHAKLNLNEDLKAAKLALKKELDQQQQARTTRYHQVIKVLTKVLNLSESTSWVETQISSAKFLGTLQMLSPDGIQRRQQNQKLKPAYKGALALRLLDKLLKEQHISNQYINDRYQENARYSVTEGELTSFQRDVGIPILMASIFQDIGLQHPKAQLILKGDDGKLDEFRVLDNDERLALLKINHEYTLDYVSHGIGLEQYVGNSKDERELFDRNEKERLGFTRKLLKDALKPQQGVGNLIKVPQIYTSVIFSAKSTHNLYDLPKAGLVVTKAAENGVISKIAAESLIAIVGHFPQGYGITYIPKDNDNKDLNSYEYAIVTELNPEDPYVPRCRKATRKLTFISNGQVISVKADVNLYFPAARKKLEQISPERLEEILRKLSSNFQERKDLELIPSHWNPRGFFGYQKLQNLWKKG